MDIIAISTATSIVIIIGTATSIAIFTNTSVIKIIYSRGNNLLRAIIFYAPNYFNAWRSSERLGGLNSRYKGLQIAPFYIFSWINLAVTSDLRYHLG